MTTVTVDKEYLTTVVVPTTIKIKQYMIGSSTTRLVTKYSEPGGLHFDGRYRGISKTAGTWQLGNFSAKRLKRGRRVARNARVLVGGGGRC
jgi:hypothetical protein